MRRAVAALGTFAGEEFRPNGGRDARFLSGEEDEAMVVFLTHPALPGPGSSVHFVLGDEEPDGSVEISVAVHRDEPGDDINPEWELAATLASRLVADLRPNVAHLTAWHIDGYGRIYPSTGVLADSGLPREFGPWTYVSGAGLTDRLGDQLASLPVLASHPLPTDGWSGPSNTLATSRWSTSGPR
ncbi:hypothetical protein GCM10029964_048930 [Kibdelosporangium lantanae]